jgi:hypothetical protein
MQNIKEGVWDYFAVCASLLIFSLLSCRIKGKYAICPFQNFRRTYMRLKFGGGQAYDRSE